MRKEQFRRPEPGFSLYEGRTRGKRMKYTYSDDEADLFSDSTGAGVRRSTRNTRNQTPAEPAGPVTTASGRQVRAPNRLNMDNSSTGVPSAATSVQGDGEDAGAAAAATTTRTGRPMRSAAANHGMNGWSSTNPITASSKNKKRKSDEYDSDLDSDEEGSEPDFGDDEEEDDHVPDEYDNDDDEDLDEEEFEEDDELLDAEDLDPAALAARRASLVFKFPIRVSFDENMRVKQIPGPPVVVEQQRKHHPRAAHRNVVVSEDDEEGDGSTSSPGETMIVQEVEQEPPAAEVISVAVKRMTPVGQEEKLGQEAADKPVTVDDVTVKSPPTPSSSEPATSLAFRGSPEVARATVDQSVAETVSKE